MYKIKEVLTVSAETSNSGVMLRFCMVLRAGDVYEEAKPTTIEPSETEKAASTWNAGEKVTLDGTRLAIFDKIM